LTAGGKAAGLRAFELPRALLLDPAPWTVETGLATPTFKLKRPQLRQKYGGAIQDLYRGVDRAAPPTKGL
jgi:long-subunit acyl-CoA synthetase (AMP-forming)